jgi:hypothetical protein
MDKLVVLVMLGFTEMAKNATRKNHQSSNHSQHNLLSHHKERNPVNLDKVPNPVNLDKVPNRVKEAKVVKELRHHRSVIKNLKLVIKSRR